MIDLTPFTDRGGDLFAPPWSDGEYTFASNGRIVLRVPRRANVPQSDFLTARVMSLLADAETLLAEYPHSSLPAVEIPVRPRFKPCENCHGTGQSASAESSSGEDCDACEGTGMVETDPLAIQIAPGVFLADNILRLLKTLPGLQISLHPFRKPLHLRFEEGDGCAMPIRPRSARPGRTTA